MLMVMASQFVMVDVEAPFAMCEDWEEGEGEDGDDEQEQHHPDFQHSLILRKFCGNLRESREFRCFVFRKRMVAVSQRKEGFFEEMQSERAREKVKKAIIQFFVEQVQGKFVGVVTDDKYVMDVYVDGRLRVFIVDFNPFYPLTDGILFTWEEIKEIVVGGEGGDGQKQQQQECHFRVVDDHKKRVAFSSMSQYRYPIDAVDLRCEKQIEEFVRSCEKGREEEEDDNDEDGDGQN